MDPQTTLNDLLRAIDNNDREQVNELLEALSNWNLKGGFLPQVLRHNYGMMSVPRVAGNAYTKQLVESHQIHH